MSNLSQKIDFRQIRDFNETISVAIAFLRQNFKILMQCIVLLAFPLVLFGLLTYSSMNSLLEGLSASNGNLEAIPDFELNILMSLLVWTVSGAVFLAAVYGFIQEYIARADFENIDLKAVSKSMVRQTLVYMGTIAFLFFTIFSVAILPGALMVVLPIIGIFLFYGLLIYLWIPLSLIFIIGAIEQKYAFNGFMRCFDLIKGHWWSTFGLYLVAAFIGISTLVLPTMLIGGISYLIATFSIDFTQLNGVAFVVFYIVSNLTFTILYNLLATFFIVVVVFRYFNLVEEKEGIGLLEKIDHLGGNDTSLELELNYPPN